MGTFTNYEDFVTEWCTSPTLEDLVKSSGLTKPTIKYRAMILRKAGVNLPELKPAVGGLDRLKVAQLNSLVMRHTKGRDNA